MRLLVFFEFLVLLLTLCDCNLGNKIRKINGVRFLVTVNDTWAEPPGCITTVATSLIKPDIPYNKSESVMVGNCDQGPLQYSVVSPGQNNNTYTLSLIFHSSVIEDASPPTCDISWNGTYLTPTNPTNTTVCKPYTDILPSCFVMDSREGYHMTYYWFHLLEWTVI